MQILSRSISALNVRESLKFTRHLKNRGRGTRWWRQILDRKWKYGPLVMRHASGHNYGNISFIVDVAMGQIPRSTERISSYRNSLFIMDVVIGNIPRSKERMSSFFLFLLLYDWLLMSYKHSFCCQRSINISSSDNFISRVQFLANVNSCSCSLYVVVRPSVCLSVCLSSVCLSSVVCRLKRSCTLLRLLKFSAMFLRHVIRWWPDNIQVKFYGDRPRGTPPSGVKPKSGRKL